ncbi:MAG: hypothetical protein LLG06_05480 [Desulfobacteraceae bacterium]|nr:hypothetical protein [Desulfobacteraceae bacterium]
MPTRKRSTHTSPGLQGGAPHSGSMNFQVREIMNDGTTRLDIVLKCDSMGSIEAVGELLSQIQPPGVRLKVIHSGAGTISKQDILMALSGSRLVVGFNVDVAPKLDSWVKDQGVEVRLYDVIYRLAEDLKELMGNMIPPEPVEKTTGKCEIIATFKSDKGIILGCRVVEGAVQVGRRFRVVSAMGPVHTARIESLQVEKKSVKEARTGQQVGVKVAGFAGGKVGDFIECYEVSAPGKAAWSPKGGIIRRFAT